jgi:signal transduction histidine kinase
LTQWVFRGLQCRSIPKRSFLNERYGEDRQVGSGLGLSIVKELTEAADGTVAVESRLGEGTTLVVSLPGASAHATGVGHALQSPDTETITA